MAIDWICYPVTGAPPRVVSELIGCFEQVHDHIDSGSEATQSLGSNDVLQVLRPVLEGQGYKVEHPGQQLEMPVLYGSRGRPRRSQRVDAYAPDHGLILEVEAGGARQNNRALLDVMKAMVLLDCVHAAIAVKRHYYSTVSDDYAWLCDWVELLYAAERVHLPFSTLTVIGY